MARLFAFIFFLLIASSSYAEEFEPNMKNSEGFLIPQGDVEKGKEAFMELKCYRCHTVGRRFSNQPSYDTDGPVLGYQQSQYLPGWIMNSIVSPSHYIQLDREVPPSQLVRKGSMHLPDTEKSAMYDFTETMTVRQLMDLVAYIQSLGGGK